MRTGAATRPRVDQRLGWDPIQVALAASLLLQVWRIQDLFPVLRVWGLGIAVSVASVVLFMVDRDPRRSIAVWRHPMFRLVSGIVLLVILSIPGSYYPGESVRFLTKEFMRSVVLMALIAASIRGLADVERFVRIQLFGAAMFCTVVRFRFAVGSNGRLGELVMYDTNDLALLIACTLPVAVYLLWRSRSLSGRGVVLGAVACLMLVFVSTGSRGGFLGLIAGAGYMILRLRAVSLGKRLAAVTLCLGLLVAFSTDRYWEMMDTVLHPSSDYNWSGNSETGRMEVWKRGVGYMATHPILGVGAFAYSSAEGALAPEALRQDGVGFKWSEAHNSFVEVGAELGVIGLILFVALFVAGFRTLSRIGRGPRGPAAFLAQTLTASLLAYVVSGFFLSAAYWTFLYALLGTVVGLAKVASPGLPVHRALRPRPSVRALLPGPSDG
jgi:O-antigen ligase